MFEALAGPGAPPVEGAVLLAVSGGPDSMAMLALAAEERDALLRRGIGLEVATVDHGLRPASSMEASIVACASRDLGLPHRILRWQGAKPSSNLQSAARRARYGLLEAHAREIGASCVLTAHHQDDQIETHLLARLRHAGSRGLAGMRLRRDLGPGVRLVRPFLDLAGHELRAAATRRGLPVVDDPSNRDERFGRVRMRIELAGLRDGERRRLLAEIDRHRAFRDAADRDIASALRGGPGREGAAVDGFGTVRLKAAVLDEIATDLRADLLGRILSAVAGAEHPPARAAIERLLRRSEGSPTVATLGGAIVATGADIVVAREFGRIGPAAEGFEAPETTVLFDHRFTVSLTGATIARSPGPGWRIAALGTLGRGNAAERTMPVLLDEGGCILAVPAVLAGKAPASGRLHLESRVGWRLMADLPPGAGAEMAG